MQNKSEILEPNAYYHIYNRANGNENIFVSDENYRFFLKKYREYILPVAILRCYCLMPNHFHFLVRIKDEASIKPADITFPKFKTLEEANCTNLQGFKNLAGFPLLKSATPPFSNQFSKLLNSYAKAFNKQQGRKGSLFMKNFKRKRITNTQYLLKLVHYIHFNPVMAGLAPKPENWKFSSYNAIISKNDTMLQKQEVIEWFNDVENFVYVHQHPPKLTGLEIDFN